VCKQVLLVGSKSATLVGKPLVSGASVMAVVEEMAKDKKVMTLKFRRRKNSKNIRGFRRQLTILRVKSITLNDESTKDLGL
jgi:large subunit ribosomal protein L21